MTTSTAAETGASDKLARVVSDLDTSSAEILRSAFNALFDQAEEWIRRAKEIEVTSVEQKREMKLARESRLALKELRVKAEHTRKRLKEESVRYGRAIDGMANVLKALVEPIESYLLEQETFAVRLEEQKKETLRSERGKVLDAYGADRSVYADLGEMSDEQWTLVADSARADREAAEKEQNRRVAAEKEAAEREAVAKKEAQAKAVEAERKSVAERRQLELALEENARLKKVAEDAEDALRISRAKTADLKRAEVERDSQEAARLAAEEALLMAPDREKLRAFADALRKVPMPVLTTRQGRSVAKKLATGMKEMVAWVEKVSEELK